jgi:parallel beta-helix repeat protein
VTRGNRTKACVQLVFLLAGLSRVVDGALTPSIQPVRPSSGRAAFAAQALDNPQRPGMPPEPPPNNAGAGPNLPAEGGVYRGTDPSRDLKPFLPKPLNVARYPGTVPADRGRTILLRLDSIDLLESDKRVRQIYFNARRPVGLEEIVDAVADPRWVTRGEDGVVVLLAALVQDVGTELRITRPAVSEVRLASLPGVFLGGTAASAHIEGVLIHSWMPERGGPDTNDRDGRPFILYEDEGARLDIIRSGIGYLGEDRVTAYGLAWRQGATGSLIDSDVHHNFFGVYTHEAMDMVFRGNRLYHNIYYGLDPHSHSARLIVEDNETWGNGTHGIVFSRNVVDSVVRRNYSHHNGGNGIMMHQQSDRNTIVVNRVEHNKKDGIVAHSSSDLLVADNLVRGNRQGIRSQAESLRNKFMGNRIVGNRRGVELYDGVRGAVLQGNVVRGSTEIGLVLDAPGSKVLNGIVEGSELGVDIRAPVSISGLRVRGVDRGVVVRRGSVLKGDSLTVEAGKAAVIPEPTAAVTLAFSNLRSNQLPPGQTVEWGPGTEEQGPPIPWTAPVAVALIGVAVALELLHRLRLRHTPRGPEQPLWNTGG